MPEPIHTYHMLVYINNFPGLTLGERYYASTLLIYWRPGNFAPYASAETLQKHMKNSRTGKPLSIREIRKLRKGCAEKGLFELWNSRNPKTGKNNPTKHRLDPKKIRAALRKLSRNEGEPTPEPTKPSSKKPASDRHKCSGCDEYLEDSNICDFNGFSLQELTLCPLEKWGPKKQNVVDDSPKEEQPQETTTPMPECDRCPHGAWYGEGKNRSMHCRIAQNPIDDYEKECPKLKPVKKWEGPLKGNEAEEEPF